MSAKKRALLSLTAATPFMLFFGWMAWRYLSGWDDYVSPSNSSQRSDLRQGQIEVLVMVVQVLGGGLFLFALIASIVLSRQTLKKTGEAQTAERFTRAVSQLGEKDQIEVRLGGIYALDRIAKDAPQDYHVLVMELLTAYVRENARLPSGDKPFVDERYQAPTDIQAILTVIGRRGDDRRKIETDRINLAATDLRGASLENLRGVFLWGACLNNASLQGADLSEAVLWYANLEGAFLKDANLQGAVLSEANLKGAFLTEANLQGAVLSEANLKGAFLTEANLKGAFLLYTNLEGAVLKDAHLEGAVLWGANLEGADLWYAKGLTQGQIDLSCMDDETILPSEPGPDGNPFRRSSRDCSASEAESDPE